MGRVRRSQAESIGHEAACVGHGVLYSSCFCLSALVFRTWHQNYCLELLLSLPGDSHSHLVAPCSGVASQSVWGWVHTTWMQCPLICIQSFWRTSFLVVCRETPSLLILVPSREVYPSRKHWGKHQKSMTVNEKRVSCKHLLCVSMGGPASPSLQTLSSSCAHVSFSQPACAHVESDATSGSIGLLDLCDPSGHRVGPFDRAF